MDERMWIRARSLAGAYAKAYHEDVAQVLGEALLEVLAEMLVPEEDREDIDAAILCGSRGRDGHECVKPENHEGEHEAFTGWVRWANASESPKPLLGVVEAKAQHPAYQPVFAPDADRVHRLKGFVQVEPHPEFLEGEEEYAAAPVGTRVICMNAAHKCDPIEKHEDGWFLEGDPWMPSDRRRVVFWGHG